LRQVASSQAYCTDRGYLPEERDPTEVIAAAKASTVAAVPLAIIAVRSVLIVLLKSDAAEVGLAFEAVESLMDDDLNGCHFIFCQLLKFTFA
jgi:hypothetical protein